jgi:hypothetical protein
VPNCCTFEASISLEYIAKETLGYLTKYMSLYGPVTTRMWDADEEMGLYSEVLEGASRRLKCSAAKINMAHDYVLRNTESLLPLVRSAIKYIVVCNVCSAFLFLFFEDKMAYGGS